MVAQQHLEDVEATLETLFPGAWTRLTSKEKRSRLRGVFDVSWRIALPEGAVRAPGVNHLLLVVDQAFPNAQARILVEDMGSPFAWPHVDPPGVLCVPASSIEAPVRNRIAELLEDALRLLNLPEEQCRRDFQREFAAYWSHRATHREDGLSVLSLVTPSSQTRQVMYHFSVAQRRVVVADTRAALGAWLYSSGQSVSHHHMQPGVLVRLRRPWLPNEFPTSVAETIDGLADELVRPALLQQPRSLFLFEATTETGPVFAAVLAKGSKLSAAKNGFRSLERVPFDNIKRALSQQAVSRVPVSRVDPAWVHGRDRSPDEKTLRLRKVAIIGCGSVGSEVAALLGKAGVGELMLLDPDDLNSANLSRHLLGASSVGMNKAYAVAWELRRRLPHLKIDAALPKRFEQLDRAELTKLAEMDLIVTAGLDIEGEAAFNAWRRTLKQPPAYVSTWVEAYCLAGHAVLLYGQHDLMEEFERERPIFRLTDWPPEGIHLITEAGCGNQFQPHGAAELLPTISMATRLVLDALVGQASDSCRRTWFGDPAVVGQLGGTARDTFTEANTMREFSW